MLAVFGTELATLDEPTHPDQSSQPAVGTRYTRHDPLDRFILSAQATDPTTGVLFF
jgi:hypothetical protein